jgi:hypothetical protein
LYIGNSNLISRFNEGICEEVLPCPFGEFRRGLELVEEEEEEEDGGEVVEKHDLKMKKTCILENICKLNFMC